MKTVLTSFVEIWRSFLRNWDAYVVVLVVTLATMFSGCATPPNSPTQHAAVKLTVQYATLKVLNNNPQYAQRAATIAGQVRKAATGEASTVDILIALARSEIKWDALKAEDVLILNELLNVIAYELKHKVGAGIITPDKAVAVAEFASWIEQAATLSSR